MRVGLRLLLGMMGCAALVGCADGNSKCGGQFLALLPNDLGEQVFQVISFSSLSNPYSLNGGAAKVHYSTALGANGYLGPAAQPRYTRSGGVCVPMDAASSISVSVYGMFERIMNFEERMGIKHMLSWPRQVGVDISVRSSDGSGHDNAHYYGQMDVMAVLPYSASGTPLALNSGVMAHEHFHAHFQRQVMNAIEANFPSQRSLLNSFYGSTKPTPDDEPPVDLRTARALNYFVLRGWNEGLADFYGAIYSGMPNYFDQSLPLKGTRALDQGAREFLSASFLRKISRRVNVGMMEDISYKQGTNLARLLFALAQSGVESREVFLARVMSRLSAIPAAILPKYNSTILDFEEVVPVLLASFPMNKQSCQILRNSLSKEIMSRSVSQCLTF